MEFLRRSIQPILQEYLLPNKVVVLLGPRRVGKTVLIRQVLSEITEPVLLLNGEDLNTRELFKRRSLPNFVQLLDGKKMLIIDEAQKIPDIGYALKLMIDEIEGLRILITGSSAFDVENYAGEPLAGRQLGMSGNTVSRYLDLLSKVFVIHRVGGFSRNLRKEVTKSSKWYFFDNGIRNILAANLNSIELRNDIGQLWENYMISERIKFQQYTGMIVNNYFWRTYDQQEINWIEERGGRLYGYEFKWNEKKHPKAPGGWRQAYPDAAYTVLTPENYAGWVK
ncbi:MAG: ATP-binding protein [Lewinellaceae bacterium]|nr:ATP-binding protein [Lewinellaceae bacterium]